MCICMKGPRGATNVTQTNSWSACTVTGRGKRGRGRKTIFFWSGLNRCWRMRLPLRRPLTYIPMTSKHNFSVVLLLLLFLLFFVVAATFRGMISDEVSSFSSFFKMYFFIFFLLNWGFVCSQPHTHTHSLMYEVRVLNLFQTKGINKRVTDCRPEWVKEESLGSTWHERTHTHTHTHSYTQTLTHTHKHSLSHTLTKLGRTLGFIFNLFSCGAWKYSRLVSMTICSLMDLWMSWKHVIRILIRKNKHPNNHV